MARTVVRESTDPVVYNDGERLSQGVLIGIGVILFAVLVAILIATGVFSGKKTNNNAPVVNNTVPSAAPQETSAPQNTSAPQSTPNATPSG